LALEGGHGLPVGAGALVCFNDIAVCHGSWIGAGGNRAALLNAMEFAAQKGGAENVDNQETGCDAGCAGEGEGEGEGENATSCGYNILEDSGFEEWILADNWDSSGAPFPLCSPNRCGGGAEPYGGNWQLWFGGLAPGSDATVQQDTIFPEDTPLVMQFYLWTRFSSGNRQDFLEIKVDDELVLRVVENNETYHDGYRLVSVEIPAEYSDGQPHVLSIRGATLPAYSATMSADSATMSAESRGPTSFFVDNVQLIAGCSDSGGLQLDFVEPDVAGFSGESLSTFAGNFDVEYEPETLGVYFTDRQGAPNVDRDIAGSIVSGDASELLVTPPAWALEGQFLTYVSAMQGETRIYSNPKPFRFAEAFEGEPLPGEGEGEGEPEAECGVNQLRNPGFNEGPPFEHWTVTGDSYFPIFNEQVVPSGVVAYYGGWGAWLGGRREALNMTLTQADVTIPEGEYPILQFYLWIQDRSQNGVDKLEVLLDGNVVWTILENDANYRNQYGLVTILLDGALADGEGDHTVGLRVVTSASNGAVTNFLVDELSLASSCNAPGTDPLLLTNVAPDVASNAGGDTVVFTGDFDAEIDIDSLGAFFSADPGIPNAELDTEGLILQKSTTELSVWVPERNRTGQYLAYVSALQDSERIYSNPLPFRFDDFASAEQARCEVEVIRDGSFEGGFNNPYWDADYDLLRPQSTGGNMLPRSGEWGLWFGGWPETTTASMSQTIRIPEGESATLSFWAHYIDKRADVESTTAANDYLKVLIDDIEVAEVTIESPGFEFDPLNEMLFAEKSVEITNVELLDGERHTLRIEGHVEGTPEDGFTHFRMDDISLVVDCEYERDDDEELEPTLRIASVSPVSASLDGTETIQITKADESDALTGLTSLQVHFIRSGASSPRPSADDAVAAANVTTDTLDAAVPERDAADLTYVYVTGVSGGTKYISNLLPFRFEANEPCPESILLDGSLELGTGTPHWRETSTHGNYLIQPTQTTDNAYSARNGNWFAQLGGTSDTDRIERATLEQTVVIPVAAQAKWWLYLSIPRRSGNNGDQMRFYVDGNYIGHVRQSDSYFHQGYARLGWDIDVYADGEAHTLLIEVEQDGRPNDNSQRTTFLVDDLCLMLDNTPDPVMEIESVYPSEVVRTVARQVVLHGRYDVPISGVTVQAFLLGTNSPSNTQVTVSGRTADTVTITTPTNLEAGTYYVYLVANLSSGAKVYSNRVPMNFVTTSGTATNIDVTYAIPSVLDRSIPNDVNLFGTFIVPADATSVQFFLDDGTTETEVLLKAFNADEVRIQVPADLDAGDYTVVPKVNGTLVVDPTPTVISLIDVIATPPDCEDNLLLDGSFEYAAVREFGTPSPEWNEEMDTFAIICSIDECYGGNPGGPEPHNEDGEFFAWFAGNAAVTQEVLIPEAESATLEFYLWIPYDSNNPNAAMFTISIDGNQVFEALESDSANQTRHGTSYKSGYQQVSMFVCDYADGQSHTLAIESFERTSPLVTGFLLDDLCLLTHDTPCLDFAGGTGDAIEVYPGFVDFGYVEPGYSTDRTVTVRNPGTELLAGIAVAEPPFSIVAPETYTLESEDSTTVTIRFSPTTEGTFDGSVHFSGGGDAPVSVYGSGDEGSTSVTSGIRINEVAPWNATGIEDSYSAYSDWIELYNENSGAVDVGGWTLTDDPVNMKTFSPLPSGTTIPGNGFLVIWATTDSSPPGELHSSFELDELNGGHVGLYNINDEQISTMDYPDFDQPDWSFAFFEDTASKAAGVSGKTQSRTPGFANLESEPTPGKVWEIKFTAPTNLIVLMDVYDDDGIFTWIDEVSLANWCNEASSIIRYGGAPPNVQCDTYVTLGSHEDGQRLKRGLRWSGSDNQDFTMLENDFQWEEARYNALRISTDTDAILFNRHLQFPGLAGTTFLETIIFNGQNSPVRMMTLFVGYEDFGPNILAHELGHFVGIGIEQGVEYHYPDPNYIMFSPALFSRGVIAVPSGWNSSEMVLLEDCECKKYQNSWDVMAIGGRFNMPVPCPGYQ
jgi:hypothetical protein